MPRLLLVDDNPSIHKIAETLLASTDIQLVCVESAQEALNLIAQGERFDVALLDIMMPDTDGWQLLDQLRMHPVTARIPIAMMAGVLDTVDPVRLEKASIQGFLKKPVELRDLGERIHKFLEAKVDLAPPPPVQDFSPFSTLPAVKLSDLPEFRKSSPPAPQAEPVVEAAEAPAADLLLLAEEDLWPEVPPLPGTGTEDLSLFAEIPAEEPLDLEELDLDSLKGLTGDLPPAPVEVPPAPAIPSPFEPIQAPVSVAEALPVFEPFPEELASLPTQVLTDETETQELPDLGPEAEPTFDPEALAGLDALSDEAFEPRSPLDFTPTAFVPDPDFLAGLGETSITPDVAVVDWSDESENILGLLAPSQSFAPDRPVEAHNRRREDELDLGELEPMPEPTPAVGFPLAEPEAEALIAEAAPIPVAALPKVALVTEAFAPETHSPVLPLPLAASAGTAPGAEELLRAIASDPALMDHLAKALVAKLSDQVLREIAWEVMPEMAERLNRH